MSKSYSWRAGARLAIDPQKAGEHLEDLRTQLGRDLGAEDVLKDAERPESPLHSDAFLWDDDTSAATQYRLGVARNIITSLVVYVEVTPNKPSVPVHAYVNVTSGGRGQYAPTEEAFKRPDGTRDLIVKRARRELLALRNKYAHLKELKDVFDAIEQLKEVREK